MNIQANGFQARALAPKTGNDVVTAGNSLRQRLTMSWQLRDGTLGMVWRLAEATAARPWLEIGEARSSAA